MYSQFMMHGQKNINHSNLTFNEQNVVVCLSLLYLPLKPYIRYAIGIFYISAF